jgi:hypothetical protein
LDATNGGVAEEAQRYIAAADRQRPPFCCMHAMICLFEKAALSSEKMTKALRISESKEGCIVT